MIAGGTRPDLGFAKPPRKGFSVVLALLSAILLWKFYAGEIMLGMHPQLGGTHFSPIGYHMAGAQYIQHQSFCSLVSADAAARRVCGVYPFTASTGRRLIPNRNLSRWRQGDDD